MAPQIQLLHSLTAGNTPGDLLPGQIAYNLADGFVYLGNGTSEYTDTLGNVIGPSQEPGGGWQQAIYNASPVNGSVTLAGLYDAIANEVTSVTPAGTAAGFTVGPLPASAPENDGYYVLVQIGGTLAPPAPAGDAETGDWLVSTGNGWTLVAQSNVEVPAANVTVVPTGWITATNMQSVLNEIVLNVLTGNGGVVANLEVNPGDLSVYGNTNLGNDGSDSTTINGTLTANGPANFGGTVSVTGALTTNAGVTIGSTLGVLGNASLFGNTVFGTSAANSAVFASAITANAAVRINNNLQVTGTTALGQVTTGALTTTGNVEIFGQFIQRQGLAVFTNNVQLGDTTGDQITVNGTLFVNRDATFVNGQTVNFNGRNNLSSATYYKRNDSEVNSGGQYPLSQLIVPAGTILPWAGTSVPAGYFLCDGQAISRNTYSVLFGAIGTTWGGGDGATTFNIPDLRGVFLRGVGTSGRALNQFNNPVVGPTAVGQYQSDGSVSHTHTFKAPTVGYAGVQFGGQREAIAVPTSQMTSQGRPNNGTIDMVNPDTQNGSSIMVQSGGLNETRGANAAVLYIIKF